MRGKRAQCGGRARRKEQVKKAFILVNTGSPAELSAAACKAFLREFLSDPDVVPAPFFVRYPLARFIASKRSEVYLANLKKISRGGVPRLVGTCAGLARKIAAATGTDTFAAHRYGAFPIAEAIRAARDSGARDFRFLPMFPQSASSTTFSVKREVFAHRREGEIFRFRENYFDDGAYISALAALFGRFGDRSLPTFASFHSVPVSQEGKTGYSAQCRKTAELFASVAGLADVSAVWQSQMGGPLKWLGPSASAEIGRLSASGVDGVNVICPGFACDCTETLVEIAEGLKGEFLSRGGKTFNYVPCLNDSPEHAAALAGIFERMK